jgi:hypothetical protein
MTNIPLGVTDQIRQVAKSASIALKNRFLEKNPVLSEDPVAAISRPAMRKFAEVGSGPIRKVFSSPGAFDGDLFVVSGDTLYRVAAADLAVTTIGAISTDTLSSVSMCATAAYEGGPVAYLWIAEGGVLWNYADGGALTAVAMPDDYGAISVAHINSYVIVIPVQSEEIKGRFYWVEPGEITVDALNFATAERNPDGVHQVVVYGDMFWLLGENTTEPWITTGDALAPMERFKGILFDRGSWEGTAVQVKDSLIVVDEDGGVFQIAGGQKRISRPDIEERIRRAIQIEGQL